MAAVHIRIRHQNNFMIPKSGNIKIIAVALGKTAAKGIDHGFNLRICKHLVHRSLLHVQDLSTDRKNSLIHSVSGCLGRAACRISLNNKNFTLLRIPAFTVSQLSIAVKRKSGLGQHISLCLFLCLPNFRRFFSTGNHRF